VPDRCCGHCSMWSHAVLSPSYYNTATWPHCVSVLHDTHHDGSALRVVAVNIHPALTHEGCVLKVLAAQVVYSTTRHTGAEKVSTSASAVNTLAEIICTQRHRGLGTGILLPPLMKVTQQEPAHQQGCPQMLREVIQ
jgi:hypothetical protein